jgi:hypothetical protein
MGPIMWVSVRVHFKGTGLHAAYASYQHLGEPAFSGIPTICGLEGAT